MSCSIKSLTKYERPPVKTTVILSESSSFFIFVNKPLIIQAWPIIAPLWIHLVVSVSIVFDGMAKFTFDNLAAEFQEVVDLINQMEDYLKEKEHGEDWEN